MGDYIQGYENIMKGAYVSMVGISTIVFIFAIFMALTVIIALLSYIFKSIALSKMSDEKYKWLCWVPLFNNSILTKVAFNNYIIGVIMSICLICSLFMSNKLGNILIFAYFIAYLISSYKVYKKYSKHYISLTIFSVITFTLTIPFMLFAIRKNNKLES